MDVLVPEIRPHFDVQLKVDGATALRHLAEYLASDDRKVEGWVDPPYAELAIPPKQRHWWSPRLALRLGDQDATPTSSSQLLHCRFQPEPGRWTMYMAMWAMLAVTTMLMIGLGYAQAAIGNTPTACVYGLPVAVLLAAGLYGSAIFGQRLGRAQVALLNQQLYRALRDAASRSGQRSADPE